MDKVLIISGKEVGLRATALTPRLYRHKIGRDIIQDMAKLQKAFAKASVDTLMEFCDVLGLLQAEADNAVDPEIQKLIDERQEARKAKNFARADEIRDKQKEKGITLKDTPQGVQIIKE